LSISLRVPGQKQHLFLASKIIHLDGEQQLERLLDSLVHGQCGLEIISHVLLVEVLLLNELLQWLDMQLLKLQQELLVKC